MLTLIEIAEKLKDRRLSVVADATGLHYNTIRNIRDQSSHSPSYETVKALSDYLTK